ncbi:MAG: LysR family transcriptional regulator [Lachnospiraceae bacterium]|nr:LysR family transcriptional regulator [Lachnospiraceae bacterium]
MDTSSLEIFIDVWQSGSLSATASNHYLTESTVSKRIAALEKELGVILFARGKGKNHVQITAEGMAFADIASRILMLNGQALRLGEGTVRHFLTVACINSVQDSALPPFIRMYRARHPEILFTLEDHRSNEILLLLEHQRIDVGITQTASPYPDLEAEVLLNEEYRVVMKAKESDPRYKDGIHPGDLAAEHEIYESYCDIFREWHDYWWPPYKSKIRVNITPTAEKYFDSPEDWMIVPASIASELEKRDYVSYPFSVPSPKHHVYLVFRKRNRNPDTDQFVQEILAYFRKARK